MLLDILVAILAGGAIIKEDCSRGNTTSVNRSKAIKENKPYYIDGFNKTRSTETNEIISVHYTGLEGHTQYKGVKTGKIYYDPDQEKINKMNQMLNGKHKKFIYVDYPQWKRGGKRILLRYDLQRHMPFMTSVQRPMFPDYKEKYKIGYITNMNSVMPSVDYNTIRKLDDGEIEKYRDKETACEFCILHNGWK